MSSGADDRDVSRWSNGPGDRYPAHVHPYDKVLQAVSGSITFVLPASEESVELQTGDRFDLPAGTVHAAEVGASGVTCLESHLPRGSLSEVRHHRADGGGSETAAAQES